MPRPAEREREQQLAALNTHVERQTPSVCVELTDHEEARIQDHIEAMVNWLSEATRAAVSATASEIEAGPDAALTRAFGFTDGWIAYLDVLTGSHSEG